jgi:2-polyprenyl-6-methoxyphenol hydroxylase-like FAD-dependent oxidoreductase
MAKIVVLGAGVCGLAAGILLRRDGHEVTVLERDHAPVPASAPDAWDGWTRDGVTQFRQAHFLVSLGRQVLQESLPDVLAGLEAAGGVRFDALDMMPRSIADRAPRDGDDRYWTINARRPTLEQVLARVADVEPGMTVRRGTTVNGLLTCTYDGTPHVAGVRADTGETFDADLVLDAMGRRSPLPRWLEDAGARAMHEEAEDSGFIYYTRFFRARGGATPDFRAPLNTPIGTFSLLTLPSDNGTWSITLYTSAGDRPLKRLRDPASWSALVGACPFHAQWLEGEPLTGILAMGGVLDRYRRMVVDGCPVATGIALVGDAWACTNPSMGRGMSLGLLHARFLPSVIRAHLDDPRDFALAWDDLTEAELAPWYRETVEEDRARLVEIEALRRGAEPDPPTDRTAALRAAMIAAVPHDPDAFRAMLAARNCVARYEELFSDDGLVERMLALAAVSEGPPPLPGPDRDQLIGLLDRAPTAV